MPFVERDGSGAIKGVYANRQPGHAEEFLADDNSELVAYRNPPTADPDLTAEELAKVLIDIGGRSLTSADVEAKKKERRRR